MDSETGGTAPVGVDDEVRRDAVDILSDVTVWHLTARRWADVRDAVGVLASAVARGDGDAVRDAVTELELLGPVRATRLGADPTTPPPAEVRDEVNELVHALDGSTPPSTR